MIDTPNQNARMNSIRSFITYEPPMKHVLILFTLFTFAMSVTHSLFAQQRLGGGIVIPVAGQARTMDASTFPSAAPEVIKRHMPEGGAPASTSSFALLVPPFGEEKRQIILFDAGLGDETWIKSLDLAFSIGNGSPEDVTLILLTHMHGDHIGGLMNGDVRRFPKAKLLCSEPEYEHWLPKNAEPRTPQIARIKAAYGEDFTTFNFDDIVFERAESMVKIKALDAAGHTPGHTVFLVEHGFNTGDQGVIEQKTLIIGDLLHAAALQFPAPEVCARFDMDIPKSIASRKRILDLAAQEKTWVRGMHFPAPYLGTVEKNDQGGYVFKASQ